MEDQKASNVIKLPFCRSEEKFRLIVESIQEGYFETDLIGIIKDTNESMSHILGFSKSALIGKKGLTLFSCKDRHVIRLFFIQVFKIGEQQKYNGNITLKDGQEIHLRASVFPVKDAEGRIIGFRGIAEDITAQTIADKERLQLQNQLQQSQKLEAIGTLAGGIAHDFNNILSAIIGYTELTLQDIPANTSQHNNLLRILNAGERARDLVKQILTFSRQAEKELTPVLVRPIVKEALKLLRASLPATIKIQTQLNSDALILADPTQIHQILINLCTNANHAMQDHGGVLSVSLTNEMLTPEFCSKHPDIAPGLHLKIQVSDTGVGISPDIIKRIFEPFFTTKERGKGTGMGLAVVHGIVKSHSGTVIVTSKTNQGSTFEIYIPVVSTESMPISQKISGMMPTGSGRILFIDDEMVQNDLARQMLERLGYHVTTRDCGQEALALLHQNPHQFDLIITDMTMPAITGDVLVEKITKLRPDIPVIICTGYSEKLDRERALSLGARGFMMKPLTMREMADLIRNVLSPV